MSNYSPLSLSLTLSSSLRLFSCWDIICWVCQCEICERMTQTLWLTDWLEQGTEHNPHIMNDMTFYRSSWKLLFQVSSARMSKGQGHPSSGSSGSSLFARDNRPDASKMKYIPADNSLSQLPERESQQRLWHSTKHTSTTQYVHSAAESAWQSAITAKTPSRDSDWLRGVKCIFLEHSTGGFVCFYPPFRAF